jgi:hypothetical protein
MVRSSGPIVVNFVLANRLNHMSPSTPRARREHDLARPEHAQVIPSLPKPAQASPS